MADEDVLEQQELTDVFIVAIDSKGIMHANFDALAQACLASPLLWPLGQYDLKSGTLICLLICLSHNEGGLLIKVGQHQIARSVACWIGLFINIFKEALLFFAYGKDIKQLKHKAKANQRLNLPQSSTQSLRHVKVNILLSVKSILALIHRFWCC